MDTHPVIDHKHKTSKIIKNIFRMLNFLIELRYKCVFVVFYFGAGGFVEDNRNYIEAKGAIVYIIGCEKIAGGSEQFGFF